MPSDRIILKCGCAANTKIKSMGGVTYSPMIDGCGVHRCIEPAEAAPDLTSRTSLCAYCREEAPSSKDLPFFEFRGEGSSEATDICQCRYHRIAHGKPPKPGVKVCGEFSPRGAVDYDRHYCGCRGWD